MWRLNDQSLAALETFLPDGILTDRMGADGGWIEDLTLFSSGVIRLRVITHEHLLMLNVTEEEHGHLRGLKLIK